MKIYKFGGASVKNANGVRNVSNIIKQYAGGSALIVVSAMGKTTNALEEVVQAYLHQPQMVEEKLKLVINYHLEILGELFLSQNHPVHEQVSRIFNQLRIFMLQNNSTEHGYVYDQIVSFGEILSSVILSAALEQNGTPNTWLDVRQYVKTNSFYREGEVNWKVTKQNIAQIEKGRIYITQGFLGSDEHNFTTTLGREGSDYSAAIFAYCLQAKEVSIWKDVPGVLNADPRYFTNPILLHQIPYQQAIELAFYGASVIHPKTLQPLQQKGITLWVRSFLNPKATGTAVCGIKELEPKVPCYILKENQYLLSLSARDFSFISEENISFIFRTLSQNKIKVTLMQNSAISFRICLEDKYKNINQVLLDLKDKFLVNIQENLKLYTIAHANENASKEIEQTKRVILKQEFNHTIQIITRN